MFHSPNMSRPSDVGLEMEHPDGADWINLGELAASSQAA